MTTYHAVVLAAIAVTLAYTFGKYRGWRQGVAASDQLLDDAIHEFDQNIERLTTVTTTDPHPFGNTPAGQPPRPIQHFPAGVPLEVWATDDHPAGGVCGHCLSKLQHGDAYAWTHREALGFSVITCIGCLVHFHVLEDA